jgi:isopentenyl phosphate kinase
MMNKRIKELAEQAGGYVSLSHEHDGKLILSGEDIVQKFAELIVRECGEFCGHDHEGVVAMFKHFGVEE